MVKQVCRQSKIASSKGQCVSWIVFVSHLIPFAVPYDRIFDYCMLDNKHVNSTFHWTHLCSKESHDPNPIHGHEDGVSGKKKDTQLNKKKQNKPGAFHIGSIVLDCDSTPDTR